jgi:dipeptidyl aminopeptidase/acylaminoacyl peptidase
VEEPVSDAEFEVFRRLYAYDSYSLNSVVEQVDTFEHWTRETVSFDVPYGERGGVFLYVPRDPEPPLQTVLFWGGSNILSTHSIDEVWTANFDYMVLEGRAVAVPLLRGSYGRDVPLSPGTAFPGPHPSATYRDATIQWVKDLSATIDYLETRPDLDAEKVGFYGYSFGARIGPIPLAVEPRIGAAVLNTAGLRRNQYFPVADPFNYVTRVRTPVLMLNGEFDIVFPYEPSQLPLFQWLGSEEKGHFVFPAAHFVPKDQVIGRTLGWFDKYLGPVGGG